jgi:hypothetical protein
MAAGWWVISQGGTDTTIWEPSQAGAAAAGTVVSGPYATQALAQAAISGSTGTGTTTPGTPLPATTPAAFAAYLNKNFAGTDGVKGHPLTALNSLGYTGATLGDQWLSFWAAFQAKDPGKPLETAEQAFVVLWEEGTLGTNLAQGSAGGLAAGGAFAASGAQTAASIFSVFQSANLWIRVGEVILGALLIAVGLAKMTGAVPIATKIASHLA